MVERALPVLTVDGATFDDLDGFASAFSAFLHDYEWRGNLDAFNDILRGGFGTPDGGFVLRWVNSGRSRSCLGRDATVAWLERTLTTCDPSNRARMEQRLARARAGKGQVLFDWLVEIIRVHGPGGDEAEDNVYVELV